MRYAIGATALLAAAALGGATGTHAQGQSQSQGQYQSVAPKKKPGKPVDPADVATLTGRPVPQSALAKSQANANASEENGNGTTAEVKRPPVNPADVDILTGRNDRDVARDYRWQPQGWEALWAAEWMGERGYRDESFLFVPGAFGPQCAAVFLPAPIWAWVPAAVCAPTAFWARGVFLFCALVCGSSAGRKIKSGTRRAERHRLQRGGVKPPLRFCEKGEKTKGRAPGPAPAPR